MKTAKDITDKAYNDENWRELRVDTFKARREGYDGVMLNQLAWDFMRDRYQVEFSHDQVSISGVRVLQDPEVER